jgi:hypothetical protein
MKRRIVPDAINFHNRTAQRIIGFCVNLAAYPQRAELEAHTIEN